LDRLNRLIDKGPRQAPRTQFFREYRRSIENLNGEMTDVVSPADSSGDPTPTAFDMPNTGDEIRFTIQESFDDSFWPELNQYDQLGELPIRPA
jgi:hypothetical protein